MDERLLRVNENIPGQEGGVNARWEEIDRKLLPVSLEGTSFTIPYDPITVRQLVVRAEFAKELGEERGPYKHIGRKISRKAFRHPLSQKEYAVIKSNHGNSPQLFFSYEGEFGHGVMPVFGQRFSPEEIVTRQVSRLGEFISDDRIVALSRIREGTNIKGKEHLRQFYLSEKGETRKTEMLFIEDAWTDPVKNHIAEYAAEGVILSRAEGRAGSAVLFVKLQNKRFNYATFFAAAEYRAGIRHGVLTRDIPLKELPVFEEMLEESPGALFMEFERRAGEVEKTEQGDAIKIRFPETLDVAAVLDSVLRGGSVQTGIRIEAPERQEENAGIEGVAIDPEVDPDLNRTLAVLRQVFGDALLGVYFYGSIPRGYKYLQSDIDIIAVIEGKKELMKEMPDFEMEENFKSGKLMHDALGTYGGRSLVYPFRGVEVHTISKRDWEHPKSLRLGEFLRNVREGAVMIYKKDMPETD